MDERTAHHLKLSEKNLKIIRFISKTLCSLSRIFMPSITGCVILLHFLAVYLTCVKRPDACSSIHMIHYTFWCFVSFLWLVSSCAMFTLTFGSFVMAAFHVLSRYRQLNQKATQPLWAKTANESRVLMAEFIQEHREITSKVDLYNEPIQWILFCVEYIFQVVCII